jgi:hypothetical protein
MVLTAYFVLSPVIGLCCHRHRRDAKHHRQLDAPTIEASGPHDFAVRKITLSSAAPPASIASRPYVRDDRETSLCVGRDDKRYEVIWVKREWNYFCEKDWTGSIKMKLKEIFPPPCSAAKKCQVS